MHRCQSGSQDPSQGIWVGVTGSIFMASRLCSASCQFFIGGPPWLITLSPVIQPWLTRPTYAVVYSTEEAQIVHSEMKRSFLTGCISMREGRTGVQQTAAESALFAWQAELAFHAWLFLGGVYTQERLRWLGFPLWTSCIRSASCPPGMIRSVIIRLPRIRDVTRKMVYY